MLTCQMEIQRPPRSQTSSSKIAARETADSSYRTDVLTFDPIEWPLMPPSRPVSHGSVRRFTHDEFDRQAAVGNVVGLGARRGGVCGGDRVPASIRKPTWANALMALVVLGAPLVARPPATVQRLLICALVWTVLGMPGAYVFGVPVFYAGCLLGVALVARLFLVRERGATPPPDTGLKA